LPVEPPDGPVLDAVPPVAAAAIGVRDDARPRIDALLGAHAADLAALLLLDRLPLRLEERVVVHVVEHELRWVRPFRVRYPETVVGGVQSFGRTREQVHVVERYLETGTPLDHGGAADALAAVRGDGERPVRIDEQVERRIRIIEVRHHLFQRDRADAVVADVLRGELPPGRDDPV